jgi:FKBP12-rapamycin complex-associated protein
LLSFLPLCFRFSAFAFVSPPLLSFLLLCFRFLPFAFVSPSLLSFLPLCFRFSPFAFVSPSLLSFQVFSASVEEHLHLVLPAMVQLFQHGVADVPMSVRRATLQSLRRLLPRMQLAGYASAITHPLVRCLDSPHEELRKEAAEVAAVLG